MSYLQWQLATINLSIAELASDRNLNENFGDNYNVYREKQARLNRIRELQRKSIEENKPKNYNLDCICNDFQSLIQDLYPEQFDSIYKQTVGPLRVFIDHPNISSLSHPQ